MDNRKGRIMSRREGGRGVGRGGCEAARRCVTGPEGVGTVMPAAVAR